MSPTWNDEEDQKLGWLTREVPPKVKNKQGPSRRSSREGTEAFSQPEVGHIERYAHEIECNPDLKIMCG